MKTNEITITWTKADALEEATREITNHMVIIQNSCNPRDPEWKINWSCIGPCTPKEAVDFVNMLAPLTDIPEALNTWPVKVGDEFGDSKDFDRYKHEFAEAIKKHDINKIIEIMKED